MKHFFYFQACAFLAMTTAFASGELTVRTKIGNACTTSEECGSGNHCIKERQIQGRVYFEDGYCVSFECSAQNPCDPGAKCVEIEGVDVSTCLAQCGRDSHCREGYHCTNNGVCLAN